MFIRKLKSRNGNIQIQVVKKINRNNHLIKHLGTARNELEIGQLTTQAQNYIDEQRIKSGKVSFFDSRYTQSELEQLLSHISIVRTLDTVIYTFFSFFYHELGFSSLSNTCFQDLVIARIIHPVSKAKTRDWIEERLLHLYSLSKMYRCMETAYQLKYQEQLENLVWDFAVKTFAPAISVLFFDVTTLYYEAFDEDDVRKCGFSKDKKDNQPQLIIALTVTTQGFPIQVRVFPGNKFEGHTMVPCIQDLTTKHNLDKLIIVADSAMVSSTNMEQLEAEGLQYIVGARLGNISASLFERVVSQTPRVDGASARFSLGNGRIMVVGYTTKRANKDRADRNKQMRRAWYALQHPASIARRYKYLKKSGKTKQWEINQTNVEKAEKLEGLKGYVTNANNLSNEAIIAKYASLWQVEKSFRISKSDLKARPIFHTVREKIEAHVTIVFAALAISRYAEIATGQSIQRLVEHLDQVKEVILQDQVSGAVISKYTQTQNQETQKLLKLAKLSWVT